jgi:hypothetical protein
MARVVYAFVSHETRYSYQFLDAGNEESLETYKKIKKYEKTPSSFKFALVCHNSNIMQ